MGDEENVRVRPRARRGIRRNRPATLRLPAGRSTFTSRHHFIRRAGPTCFYPQSAKYEDWGGVIVQAARNDGGPLNGPTSSSRLLRTAPAPRPSPLRAQRRGDKG